MNTNIKSFTLYKGPWAQDFQKDILKKWYGIGGEYYEMLEKNQ